MTTATEPAAGAARRGPSPAQRAVLTFVLEHLVWLILVVVIVALSLSNERFASIDIYLNIGKQATVTGVMAIGLALVVIAGHLDLSNESVMAFAAMLCAYLVATGGDPALGLDIPTPLMFVLTIAIGAGIGFMNGFLVVKLRINAFIVTLGTWMVFRGLVHVVSGGRTPRSLPDLWRDVALINIPIGDVNVPLFVVILIVAFLAFGFLLERTRLGRYIYLIGGNPTAPYRAGVPVDRILIVVFMLAGGLAAFGGWLLAARTDSVSANLGIGMLFEVFAAVVIGGVSLRGGVGRLSGVFAGVLLLSTITTAITVMRIDVEYQRVVFGAIILLAVLLDNAKIWLRKRLL